MRSKLFIAGAVALALSGCLPSSEQNAIIVDGEATVEFEPELFNISGAIRSRKESSGAALSEVSASLARIRETIPQLENLTNLTIEESAVELRPVPDLECFEAFRYRGEESCPITAYFGAIHLSITGSPAALSGQALSLLSELGMEEVTLQSYALLDTEKAREIAIVKATQDARAKAERIAAAAGATIGAPIRIQFGDGFPQRESYGLVSVASPGMPEEVAVTGARVASPTTSLDLRPGPIRMTSKVVAAFAIEKSTRRKGDAASLGENENGGR